ncbi:MAG TPA: YetF domain-containing protein [Woeseiaceae bacterium]
MLEDSWAQVQSLLGQGSAIADVGSLQMTLRTIVVYLASLIIVRLASRRFLSQASAFDAIVAIMLGSIMSRGINGSAALLPTVVAGAVLVGLHWLFAALAWHTSWFGTLVKGRRLLLIRDGKVQEGSMRKASITSEDLAEALRTQAGHTDPARFEAAWMERSGKISVKPYPHEPHVVEVAVQSGVQTVRIEL